MSHWNFRLVDMTEENGNEPYIELREVHYNDEGIPIGHTPACMGAETLDGIKEVMQWHTLALGKPILYESDFVGKYEDDKDNIMNEQHILDIYNLEQTIDKMKLGRFDCVRLLETALSAMNNPNGLDEFRTQVIRERIEVCLDILNTHNDLTHNDWDTKELFK